MALWSTGETQWCCPVDDAVGGAPVDDVAGAVGTACPDAADPAGEPAQLVLMASVLLAAHCFWYISMLFALSAASSESLSQPPPGRGGGPPMAIL
jgi:hypothetical protein